MYNILLKRDNKENASQTIFHTLYGSTVDLVVFNDILCKQSEKHVSSMRRVTRSQLFSLVFTCHARAAQHNNNDMIYTPQTNTIKQLPDERNRRENIFYDQLLFIVSLKIRCTLTSHPVRVTRQRLLLYGVKLHKSLK